MKKIIGLLLISLAVFFNIDGVEADVDRGTHKGSCTLIDSSDDLCSYKCSISATDDFGYENTINFNYTITSPNNITNTLEVTDTKSTNEIQSYPPIFGPVASSSSLYSVTDKIVQPLDPDIFVSSGKFKCRAVVPKVSVTSYALNLIVSTTIYKRNFFFNHDPDQIADDKDNLQKPVLNNDACGLLGGENSATVKFIKKIYGFVKILIPILIILLSVVDFIKVVGTGKDDDMKKTLNKFTKRIIIAIVFVIVPYLIEIIISISGVSTQYPTLGDGTKAIFCILG